MDETEKLLLATAEKLIDIYLERMDTDTSDEIMAEINPAHLGLAVGTVIAYMLGDLHAIGVTPAMFRELVHRSHG